MTNAETRLWFRLRRKQLGGFRFRRQHPIGRFIVDFACPEACLAIELDGSQHLDSHSDQDRDSAIRESGFRILRFWNDDVLMNTDSVLDTILAALSPNMAI